jgi:hypothetical protein
VLEVFTTEELAQRPLDELAAYLESQGRGCCSAPQTLASTWQRAARDSYRLDEPLTLVLGTTMATIKTLQAQLKAVDATIARQLQAIPQLLDAVPGLGPVWTAGLIAEIGDIQRFADDGANAQYAGLVWNVHESGHFQAEDTGMAKAGNTYLRYYLVEAANSVRMHCSEYSADYQTKLAQPTKHAHKRALVLTDRKLVRLVAGTHSWVLLRTDTRYQSLEHRRDRKEGTPPTTSRPGRHRHTQRARALGSPSHPVWALRPDRSPAAALPPGQPWDRGHAAGAACCHKHPPPPFLLRPFLPS